MNTSRINPLGLLLVLALVGVAGYAVYAHWHTGRKMEKQAAEVTELKERWQETTNTVTVAKSAEHEQAMEGFLKPEQVRWKLFYDRGKQRNFLEVRVRNPLQYHRASFGLNFEGQTEVWAKEGRQADPRAVSLDVVVHALQPGEGQLIYRPFPAVVATRAVGWWGKVIDCLRWSEWPVVEPPVDIKTVQVRVYAQQAAWADEANPQVAPVAEK